MIIQRIKSNLFVKQSLRICRLSGSISLAKIKLSFARSQIPGSQNLNKTFPILARRSLSRASASDSGLHSGAPHELPCYANAIQTASNNISAICDPVRSSGSSSVRHSSVYSSCSRLCNFRSGGIGGFGLFRLE